MHLPNALFPVRRNTLHQCSAAALILALVLFSYGETQPLAKVDATRYLDDIKTLTAPSMEGRGDDTKGITRAAHLLEKRYRDLGLQPAGSNSYFQPFSVITGAKLRSHNRLTVENGLQKQDLKLNQDFVPFSFSAAGSLSAPVVFAGYGASADEFGYDDYAGIDVKDKIVVVLRYEPAGFAEKSGHTGFTRHSQLISKAINARNHGAKAVVLVNGKLGDGEEDLLTRFGSVSGPENTGIVLVQVKNDVADGWLRNAGKSLADLQGQINHSTKPQSFAFPDSLRMAIHVDIETTPATVDNVLAYLP